MSKLPISKEQEAEALARVWNMGCQSLHPEMFIGLETIIAQLCETRSVNIDNEILQAEYIKLSGKEQHCSDCPTSDAPAMVPGPCDCKYRLTS